LSVWNPTVVTQSCIRPEGSITWWQRPFNLAHIKRFDKQDGGYIVLANDVKIPVASRKREEMLGLIEEMAK